MKMRKGFLASELMAFSFIVLTIIVSFLALLGWIFNIIALASMNFDKFSGEHVIRIIGIFMPPVGAFAGWLL